MALAELYSIGYEGIRIIDVKQTIDFFERCIDQGKSSAAETLAGIYLHQKRLKKYNFLFDHVPYSLENAINILTKVFSENSDAAYMLAQLYRTHEELGSVKFRREQMLYFYFVAAICASRWQLVRITVELAILYLAGDANLLVEPDHSKADELLHCLYHNDGQDTHLIYNELAGLQNTSDILPRYLFWIFTDIAYKHKVRAQYFSGPINTLKNLLEDGIAHKFTFGKYRWRQGKLKAPINYESQLLANLCTRVYSIKSWPEEEKLNIKKCNYLLTRTYAYYNLPCPFVINDIKDDTQLFYDPQQNDNHIHNNQNDTCNSKNTDLINHEKNEKNEQGELYGDIPIPTVWQIKNQNDNQKYRVFPLSLFANSKIIFDWKISYLVMRNDLSSPAHASPFFNSQYEKEFESQMIDAFYSQCYSRVIPLAEYELEAIPNSHSDFFLILENEKISSNSAYENANAIARLASDLSDKNILSCYLYWLFISLQKNEGSNVVDQIIYLLRTGLPYHPYNQGRCEHGVMPNFELAERWNDIHLVYWENQTIEAILDKIQTEQYAQLVFAIYRHFNLTCPFYKKKENIIVENHETNISFPHAIQSQHNLKFNQTLNFWKQRTSTQGENSFTQLSNPIPAEGTSKFRDTLIFWKKNEESIIESQAKHFRKLNSY